MNESHHHKSIYHLPNEILVGILRNLPTSDVLHNGRFVSKLWSSISTSICQQRYVIFKELNISESKLHVILDNFKETEILPWSALTLELRNNVRLEAVTLSKTLAEKFGQQVKSLSAYTSEVNYNELLVILGHMPNLEKLRIHSEWVTGPSLPSLPQPTPIIFPITEVLLKKLKEYRVKFSSDRQSIDFLEILLLQIRPPLTTIKFHLGDTQPKDFDRVVKLLSTTHIPQVCLELVWSKDYLNLWKLLLTAKPQLNIIKLIINSKWQYPPPTDKETSFFETFLASWIELRKVKLINFTRDLAQVGTRFRIPPLPKMMKIGVTVSNHPAYPILLRSNLQFQPLQSKDYPQLTQVTLVGPLQVTGMARDFDEADIIGTSFPTVTSLQVYRYRGYGAVKWATLFPNLVKLVVPIHTHVDLVAISDHLPKLEDLHIRLSSDREDVNGMLSQSFASHLAFKGLKKLWVENDEMNHYDGDVLKDDGAMLLNSLHPMDLKLSNAVISAECVTQLRSRHLYFQLDNKVINYEDDERDEHEVEDDTDEDFSDYSDDDSSGGSYYGENDEDTDSDYEQRLLEFLYDLEQPSLESP